MAGYIKLHRGWQDSDVFKREAYCQRAAWVWILEKAAWKSCHRRDAHGNIVKVQRGQLHTSSRVLAEAWGWSKNKAERFLRDLEKCQMLDRQTDQHGVLLTVCNYEKYQGERDRVGPADGPESDQSRTTQEESKEVKEGNKRRAFALPEWVPSDAWEGFVSMRKAIRKPLTENAKSLAVNKLRDLRSEGHAARDVLEQSTLNSWQGLFPVKGGESERMPIA